MYISIILIILFFTLLFYYIYKNRNKVISYQIIKDNYVKKDYDLKNLNNKYKRYDCDDYCSARICKNYKIDKENYLKCLNCQAKFQCYNSNTDKCENCFSLGIGQCITPIDPKYNLCA